MKTSKNNTSNLEPANQKILGAVVKAIQMQCTGNYNPAEVKDYEANKEIIEEGEIDSDSDSDSD